MARTKRGASSASEKSPVFLTMRTAVKVLLPRQQHQGLLQWIKSWATQ